jgi:hypothetical protein
MDVGNQFARLGGAVANNPIPQGYAGNAPKELGLMQRVEGLRCGLQELRERLEGFGGRIAGHDTQKSPSNGGAPIGGMPANLSVAEENLRECMALLSQLNEAF